MPMNQDLHNERLKASFKVETLTHLLDGGADRTSRRRQIQDIIAKDPTGIFSNDENYYLHRNDRHVNSMAKFVRMVELCRKLGMQGELTLSPDFIIFINAVADDFNISLHWVMFVPNIRSLCDDEQQRRWLPLCRDFRMIGCYAQTELGHGSNVRALETTATFLAEKDGGMSGGSWIINSPTITSAKFWPGTLGKTANHAMVIARLIDGTGIDRGIHNFLVPLRSLRDHSLLPGVSTGDIGPKIGYNTMDNGYARFDNVQIPRRNMAMRFATVDEHGRYSKKSSSEAQQKIAYITMMQVRAYICDEAGKNLAKACTIAIRYSAVRRQGFKGKSKEESQILDYKQQQHRLFPLLAASYCFFFTGKKLLNRLKDIEHRIISNKNVSKQEVTDIHASSSSLKSFTTTVAADGMEDCRKACGGHGFLQASGLPELVTTYLQNPTVEGDNYMLPQQVIKVLMKLVERIKSGKDLSDYNNCDSQILIPSIRAILTGQRERYRAESKDATKDLTVLEGAFRHRAARLLVEVTGKVHSEVQSGSTMETAWNNALVEMARASRAYAQLLLLSNFVEGITLESSQLGPAETKVLRNLAQLFGLYWMEREVGDFLEDGYLSSEQARWTRQCVLDLLDVIRPNAVALVDARDFSDFVLKSVLGRFDGDVYPAIMKSAFNDPLNAQDPGPNYVHLKRLIVDGVGAATASRL